MVSGKDQATTLDDRYADSLKRYLSRRGFQPADVDDASQEVLLRLLETDEIDKLDRWVARVARNVAVDFYRRHRTIALGDALGEVSADLDPVKALSQKELMSAYQSALRALPEDQLTPFLLRFEEKLLYADIAERLGSTVPAVTMRTFRAVSYLRGVLARFL